MPLRVCFLTAEMTPFAKAGGLSDVSGALVKYLHAAGHDIRLFLPGHASIKRSGLEIYPVDFLQDVPLAIGPRAYRFSVQTARIPGYADLRLPDRLSGVVWRTVDLHRRTG